MIGGWALKEISREIQGRVDISSMPVTAFDAIALPVCTPKGVENHHARMALHPRSDRLHCRVDILSSPRRGALELGCETDPMTAASRQVEQGYLAHVPAKARPGLHRERSRASVDALSKARSRASSTRYGVDAGSSTISRSSQLLRPQSRLVKQPRLVSADNHDKRDERRFAGRVRPKAVDTCRQEMRPCGKRCPKRCSLIPDNPD
jgi:hypothetical protein